MNERKRKIRRLAPCSQLDIERLESWLTDMAAEGWHLKDRVGPWKMWFVFEPGKPKAVRYRLEPGKRGLDDDLPGEMEQAFFQDMGWEAVTSYGPFFIFRALTEDAPEMNTELPVQRMAMKKLRSKTIWLNLFTLALVPLLAWRWLHEGFRFLITFGGVVSLLIMITMVTMAAELVAQMLRSGTLVRKMKQGIGLDHRKPWRRCAWYHRVTTVTAMLFYVLYMVSMLTQCSNAALYLGRDIDTFAGDLPFVTIGDLCPEGKYTRVDFPNYNTYLVYSSDCAPVNVEWEEYAEVVTPEGETLSGALLVHYHETAAEWIARGLAEEYLRVALGERYHHAIPAPELDVDFVGAYALAGRPTLILQKENVVITATIGVEYRDSYMMQQWAEIMLEMLDK